MQPNPVLKKLGFRAEDRLVIIHTDDIGMCQASAAAFADLVDFGLISSGATMVPCSWFPAVAAYCREHQQVDMGVHITLTSEWDAYRWGPISTCDRASGLIDEEGYFHRSQLTTQEKADPAAVEKEINAQIEMALAAGIQATHIDTHMGTVAHLKFAPAYIQAALHFGLPPMFIRTDAAGFENLGLDAVSAQFAANSIENLEAQGVPLLDHLIGLPLNQPENRLELAKKVLDSIPPGITHFIIHPSKNTPELRHITPDWPSRVADYQTFSDDALRKFIQDRGIQVIGYQALKDLLRSTNQELT